MVVSRAKKTQELTKLYTALLIQAGAAVALWRAHQIYDPALDIVMNSLGNAIKAIKDKI